jgi:predicted metal-binding membrane protein
VIWTAGMAAMMFPAISPMVLLYDRMIKNKSNNEHHQVKKEKEFSLSERSIFTNI